MTAPLGHETPVFLLELEDSGSQPSDERVRRLRGDLRNVTVARSVGRLPLGVAQGHRYAPLRVRTDVKAIDTRENEGQGTGLPPSFARGPHPPYPTSADLSESAMLHQHCCSACTQDAGHEDRGRPWCSRTCNLVDGGRRVRPVAGGGHAGMPCHNHAATARVGVPCHTHGRTRHDVMVRWSDDHN